MICYATAGLGHRRAAEAVLQAVRALCPEADSRCLDLLDYTPRWFRAGYSRSYLFLVRHLPWIWKLSYRVLDVGAVFRLVQPLRRAWNVLIARRFVDWLRQWRPDVIVATHFFPADVCASSKRAGWLKAPLVVIVTDLYPHRIWVTPACDAIVVSTEESAVVCERRGVSRRKIHVLGIPIAKPLAATADRRALKERFRLDPDRRTVLVTSGGTTIGQFERVIDRVLDLESTLTGRLQLLVVCGEDESARRRLAARAATSPVPVYVFGLVNHMAELMAVSDLIVAKAGGLTVSEALAQGVPLILYHVIPGQERLNAEYVSRHGAALIAQRPADVAAAVKRCFEEPGRLQTMRRFANALARPLAAEAVVSQVLKPLAHAKS